MPAFRSIVFSAALAGLIVGIVVTVAQRWTTVPLILQAEVYERGASGGQQPVAVHEAPAWEPSNGLERTTYTALFNILDWVGFGLLLNAAIVLLRRPATSREGLLWGLGGFVVFILAPGLGLPPELPAVPAAPLLQRQLWWVGTALATAAGLYLIAFRRSPAAAAIAIAAIAAPHLIGAPRLDHVETAIPDALSRQFIVAVTMTALPCWALLGALTGAFYRRFSVPDTVLRQSQLTAGPSRR